jgi:hypothetical protein
LIFSKKILARAPPETCLELSFRIFPLVLIVGQPKNSGNSKKKKQTSVNSSGVNYSRQNEDPDFEGSELREDQSPCTKKLFFIGTNHICTELLQKTESQRLSRPWLNTSASLVFIGIKTDQLDLINDRSTLICILR